MSLAQVEVSGGDNCLLVNRFLKKTKIEKKLLWL